MDWLAAVDGYCERTGPGYWAEPVNALTNMAFLAAAVVIWPRVRGLPAGQGMVVLLAVIGVGSWMFHTHANRLTGLMDVVPILAFILSYVFVASRDFLQLRPWQAGLIAAAFLPYAMALVPLFGTIPFLRVSAFYWPVPKMILIFAWLVRTTAPVTARGLASGAGVLTLSLVFRSLDGALCAGFPLGTHFMWHLLNAVMLAWMVEVWRRHVMPR